MPEMPIDIGALMNEVANLNGAKDAPVSVSMYIDDTAADDCIAFARNAFASASANARFSISYLLNSDFVVNEGDDFAVIVAGRDSRVGERASQLRDAGVPVMVVTTCPKVVGKIALDTGFEIPERDIVAPEAIGFKDSKVVEAIGSLPKRETDAESSEPFASDRPAGDEAGSNQAEIVVEDVEVIVPEQNESPAPEGERPSTAVSASADASESPDAVNTLAEVHGQARPKGVVGSLLSMAATAASRLRENATASDAHGTYNPFAVDVPPEEDDTMTLDDDLKALLNKRMGRWVIDACHDKGLALSVAFPFVRKPFAENIVNVTAVQNAGIGVVLFIPGADMPVMTLNQCKMILQIASAYDMEMTTDRVFEIVAIVAGGFACRGLAREILGVVPVMGWAVKGAIGYSGTLAMGKAAIEYFESGSGVMGVAGLGVKITDAVQKVVASAKGQEAPEEKKSKAEAAKDFAKQASKVAVGAASNMGPVAQAAGKVAAESFASGLSSMASSFTKK